MTKNTAALGKIEFAALDLLRALPEGAKVRARANAAKGIISKPVADRLVSAGKAHWAVEGDVIAHGAAAEDAPVAPPVEPKALTGQDLLDAQEKVAAEKAAAKKTSAPKVNGRKAAAEKSPYSTAPVAGRIKRHGKSRRTKTMTEIEDLLHKDASEPLKGSGRYMVRCLDHKTGKAVPDMTTAKPLQARTDEFCPKCRKAVEADTTPEASNVA
jgi:hypothetical protein